MFAARLILVTTLCFAVAANAQSWSELSTLAFSPYRPVEEVPVAEAAASAASGTEAVETQEELLERLVTLTAALEKEAGSAGANSPALIDGLIALADIRRQLDDHSEALVALDRAQHIVRIHEGLYTLEQVAIVEAMIASLAASEDYLETLPLERYLLELVQRNPDDPRVVELITDIADRQMAASQYYLENELPPAVIMNVQSTSEARWGRNGQPLTARRLARTTLLAARRNYDVALRTALVDDDVRIADLLELQARMVDSLYFEFGNADKWRSGHGYNSLAGLGAFGRRVLEAKLNNSRRFPGTPEAVARAMIELADWRLLFASNGAAMQSYREAWQFMLDNRVSPEIIAELLSPSMPVSLPANLQRYRRDDPDYRVTGWFDVELSVNRYGRVIRLELQGRSTGVVDAIERRFKDHVHGGRFRPRLTDGDFADGETFSLRYYYRYSSQSLSRDSSAALASPDSERRDQPFGT